MRGVGFFDGAAGDVVDAQMVRDAQATHFETVIGLLVVLRLDSENGGDLPIDVVRAIYAATDEAMAQYRSAGVPTR